MSSNRFSALADNDSDTEETPTPIPSTPIVIYRRVGQTKPIRSQTAESAASSHSLKTNNLHPESSERDEEDDEEEESEKSTSEEEFQEVQEALGQPVIETPTEERSPKTELINIDLPSPSAITHPNPILSPTPTAMATPAAATTGSPKELRVNTPTPFEGDRSKLRTFLLDCELYLLINQEIYGHDDKKITFVLSYPTGGDASMWKNQWLQSKRTGTMITLGTYAAFFADLTDAFKEEEQVQNTLYKIHNL